MCRRPRPIATSDSARESKDTINAPFFLLVVWNPSYCKFCVCSFSDFGGGCCISEPLAASHTTAQPQPVIWGQASMMLAICLVLRFFFSNCVLGFIKNSRIQDDFGFNLLQNRQICFFYGWGKRFSILCVCVWHFAVICGVCCTTFHVHSSGWFDVLSFGSSFWLSRSSALSVCVCVVDADGRFYSCYVLIESPFACIYIGFDLFDVGSGILASFQSNCFRFFCCSASATPTFHYPLLFAVTLSIFFIFM